MEAKTAAELQIAVLGQMLMEALNREAGLRVELALARVAPPPPPPEEAAKVKKAPS